MSAERLSFGLHSLIPETYKTKAEAFARCLQHRLLSLGRTGPVEGGPGGLGQGVEEGEAAVVRPGDAAFQKKTEDSEEEFCSHSESENEPGRRKQKLTSMSSEDSTVDSWSSCQESLTDVEKMDSEAEEVGSLAAQVRGSPKLRSFNIRAKRKELREKTWKKNPRRNHSSSTESMDSEGLRQGQSRQTDGFDREFSCQYILLDGLEPEDEDVPHRILRESSSTSSLERHFCCREDPNKSFKVETRVSEERPAESELLTPPPSPDVEGKPSLQEDTRRENLNSHIQFAEIKTDSDTSFVEVEALKTSALDEVSRPVRKVGGVVVECPSEGSSGPKGAFAEVVVTCVEVLQDAPTDDSQTDIEIPEDDEILSARSRMRRCSSLKTWKTPPGTPGAKKIVRFADALGLDLADVRTFLDEIPKVPTSAFEHLHFDLPAPQHPPPPPPPPPLTLLPLFRPPATPIDLLHRLQAHNICLESTLLALDGVPTITAFVRVRNLGFHKSVHVRYTLNDWHTFSDLQASYVPNSCDGFSDRFSFALYAHTLNPGQKLEFALRLDCSGEQHWDNNGGANYAFRCLPHAPPADPLPPPCATQPDPWFDFY